MVKLGKKKNNCRLGGHQGQFQEKLLGRMKNSRVILPWWDGGDLGFIGRTGEHPPGIEPMTNTEIHLTGLESMTNTGIHLSELGWDGRRYRSVKNLVKFSEILGGLDAWGDGGREPKNLKEVISMIHANEFHVVRW